MSLKVNMSHDKFLGPFRSSMMSGPMTNTWSRHLWRHLLDRMICTIILQTCRTSSIKSIFGLNYCICGIPHFPIRESVGSRTSLFNDLEGLAQLGLFFLVKSRFPNLHERITLKNGRFCSTALGCVSFKLLLFNSLNCWTQRLISLSLAAGTLIWRSPMCNLECNVRPCRSSAGVWWVVACLVAQYVCKKLGTNDFQGFPSRFAGCKHCWIVLSPR